MIRLFLYAVPLTTYSRHTVYSLIDVRACYSSNFELLAAPVDGVGLYSRAFQLTDDGKAGIIGLAAAVGAPNPTDAFSCTQCTGTQGSLGRGFRAMVYGVVTADAEADGTPATIHVIDAVATHDQQGAEFCTGAFPTVQNLAFGQPRAITDSQTEPAFGTETIPVVDNTDEMTDPATVPAVDSAIGVTDPSTVDVGDNICFEGFVMDNYW